MWLNTNIPTTQKPPRTNWMLAIISAEFRATSNRFKSFLHLLNVQSSIPDVQTHRKQTDTFQYTNFYSCHPPGVKKGFIKGEALHLLRTNSSHSTFNKNMQIASIKTRLKNRGYVEKSLFGLELLSRTVHKALTIDPDNCFEHNRFNHSKSVNLTRTTKTLVNRRRLHNLREFAG